MRTWLPSTMNRWLIWTESDITNCHLPQTVNQPSAWFFLKTGLKQKGKIIINLNSHKFKNTLKFKNKLNFTFEFKKSWKHRLQLLKPYLCTWFYLAIGQYSLAQWMAKDSPKFWASLCKEAGQLNLHFSLILFCSVCMFAQHLYLLLFIYMEINSRLFHSCVLASLSKIPPKFFNNTTNCLPPWLRHLLGETLNPVDSHSFCTPQRAPWHGQRCQFRNRKSPECQFSSY